MAKVKIQGHASGTGILTVTAPNTSTDRVITLPDATATIATTTDVAARLPSITDGGNATAITITSAEYVGIGVTDPAVKLEVRGVISAGAGTDEVLQEWAIGSDNVKANIEYTDASTSRAMNFGTSTQHALILKTDDTTRLTVTHDGRGVSQFTAHAWGKINGTGTPALITGHNVSSITDVATGRYRANYTNNSAGANTVVISGQNNSYYDEIYHVDVDASTGSLAAFGCTRSGTSAGWFDTYKMTFVTFAT